MRQSECEQLVKNWLSRSGYAPLGEVAPGWHFASEKDGQRWLVRVLGDQLNAQSTESDFARAVGEVAIRINQSDTSTHPTLAVAVEPYKDVLQSYAQSKFWSQMDVGMLLVTSGATSVSYLAPEEVGEWLRRL